MRQRDEQREEELELVFRVHTPELIKHLSKVLGSAERAQEIAQETYAQLWQALRSTKEPIRNPAGLLFTVATRLVAADLRKRYRDALLVQKIAPIATTSHGISAESEALLGEGIYQLERAVERLRPAILRDVWILRKVLELEPGEICARLGISMRAYEHRLSEAHGQLASFLSDLGVDLRVSD